MNFPIQNLISWLFTHGFKIFGILIATYFVNRILKFLIERALRKVIKNKLDRTRKKRAETLMSVFGGTSRFIILIIALLMILSELNVNIAPILAGVGIAGLAVGMAAREIVLDFIAGLFILLENQYHIGDKIKIAGLEGEVIEITLRRTTIKDSTGVIHAIPNSQIKIVSKQSE